MAGKGFRRVYHAAPTELAEALGRLCYNMPLLTELSRLSDRQKKSHPFLRNPPRTVLRNF